MIHHLYFASCVSDGGIYHYVLQNGTLTFAEKTVCDRPMYLDITEESVQVLLLEQNAADKESALVEYPLQPDGSLGAAGAAVSTKGIEACHLCRYQGQTYVANYQTGSIFAADGSLKLHTGHGVHPTRQEGAHLHFVQPSPDQRCLFAVDLGMDTVCSYDEDLNLLSAVKVPEGSGPRHLAYSEDGTIVFCVNELASSVSVFAYSDTKLTLLQTVHALKEENPQNISAAIRVCGSYVYVSNRGDDSISCLEWDGKNLQLCSVTPCGGKTPRDFMLVEDLLFCTNLDSDSVTIFRVNGSALCRLEQELHIPAPLCAVKLSFP